MNAEQAAAEKRDRHAALLFVGLLMVLGALIAAALIWPAEVATSIGVLVLSVVIGSYWRLILIVIGIGWLLS